MGFTYSHGCGINDQDVVVGLSRSDLIDHATVWGPNGAHILLPYASHGYQQSAAYAANNHGWIVGREYETKFSFDRVKAVLWTSGAAFDINSLVVRPPGGPYVHVAIAWDVNDQGQIAARGVVEGALRALRLDPL